MAEMLGRQPSDVQSMLLRTSIVDRLNGELADLLAGRVGTERLLLELEDANAFVVSLDSARTWFRYHQLLADFLRLELRRRLADEVPELHRRAAQWFADRGEVVEAVEHTLAAGDLSDAARLVADHSFRWVLDGQAGTIRSVLQAFPEGASADHPDLALAHAAAELNQGRLDEAAAQLALAESHVQSAPSARRQRLAVAIASLRLALARRSGRFSEVIEQVNLLDASIADGSDDQIAMGSELRAVALLNLGIVETWSGRLADSERHLSEGAELARTLGRPYLEVACRAHQGFPSKTVSVSMARERGRQAVALAERYGLGDRPILAPALGAVGCMSIWMGEFDEGERWLRRAWEVAEAHALTRASAWCARAEPVATGSAARRSRASTRYAGAGQRISLPGSSRLQSLLLPGVARFSRRPRIIVDGSAATQASALAGCPMKRARTLTRILRRTRANRCHLRRADGRRLQRPCGDLPDGGGPPWGLGRTSTVSWTSLPPIVPAFTLVETHPLLAGIAHLALEDRSAAAAAAEAALAVAEPDRLIFPFAMAGAADLLDALPRHQTAHGALLADVVDLLRGAPALEHRPEQRCHFASGRRAPAQASCASCDYLPTNLTRPARSGASELLRLDPTRSNTHIRKKCLFQAFGVA